MNNSVQEPVKETRQPNGRLTFYHANAKGTGAAARLELKLNRDGDERRACFFLEMSKQKTAAVRESDTRTPATFDWDAKATVKLGFTDVCEMLAVLDSRQEQAGGRRNGLYHQSGNVNTIITLKKAVEFAGYDLGISRKDSAGNEVFRGHILLNEVEALGLRYVFQAGLFHLAFHASLQS